MRTVNGIGPLDAKIAMIGEAPGATEVKTGEPFTGASGELLTKVMQNVGVSRKDIYITNVVKEQPPGNNIEHFIKFGTSVTMTPLYKTYEDALYEELKTVKANVFVAIGNVSLWALCRLTAVTKRRGSILDGVQIGHRKVIPLIHPAAALRQYLFTQFIAHDMRRIEEESNFPEIRSPARKYRLKPSFFEVMDYLNTILETCTEVAFDIEVMNEEVSCISFATSAYDVMSIPFMQSGREYFNVDQEKDIWVFIARILENIDIKKVGQNIVFDSTFLFRKFGIRTRNIEDTMIAQGISYPDFPKGLDFITSIYTKEPYYKDEGKKWFKFGGSEENFWLYNAKDSAVCFEAMNQLRQEVERMGNKEAYKEQVRLIEPLVFMQEIGTKANVAGMRDASKQADTKLVELQKELNALATRDLNINSNKQLQEYFYVTKGAKAYINRKTGAVSVDATALKRLSRVGYKEAEIILTMRHIAKLKSTYFNMKIDDDNRIRCSFNPVGTSTGRLSSSKTIFGTGGNMQNLPPAMLKFLLADDDHFIYNIDMSQAENRVVAYIAPEPNMIAAFENKTDMHKQTAGLIFGKPIGDVSDEKGSSSIGGGSFSERFWGKKANHCKLRTCEVLTQKGWIPITEAYISNSAIAQWDISGAISFVIPSNWFVDMYTGDIHTIENQRIFQECTPEHKMPLFYSSRDKLRFTQKTILKYPKSGHHFAPISGVYKNGTVTLPKCLVQLVVAFQADGTWNGNGISIKVSKPRKVTRLKKILSSLHEIGYDTMEEGVSAKSDVAKFIKLLLGQEKLFGPWLLELSQESMKDFLDELPHWDGYMQRNQYFTTDRNNAEWVQTISHLCGMASIISQQDNSQTNSFGNKIVYINRLRDSTTPATSAIKHSIRKVVNEPILCPTVDTGYFMCRENGLISVTGNSLNYDFGYKAFALLYEIKEAEARFIVDRFHLAYPGIRQYHAWVRNKLANNRTLENCLGRKRLFLDRWGDELFKEAYAYIPQSTVAGKVNRDGINFIYYNQQWFSPVVLLNQVHDSIVFQISRKHNTTVHAECLLRIRDSLESQITFRGTSFSIPTDLTVGTSLNKETMKGVKLHEQASVEGLARLLSDIHGELRASQTISPMDWDSSDSILPEEEVPA